MEGNPQPTGPRRHGSPPRLCRGPLLFTLLLADVGKGVRSDTVITAYADDVALWRKSRHRRPKRVSAQHKAELRVFQSQIELVVAQLTSLEFSLSSTTTVYMPVHQVGYNRGEYPNWNHITVCGSPVKPTASARYLGVIFQRDGRWTKHIQQVSRNARRALNLVRAIRHESCSKHRATLIPIVESLVRYRLLFGAPALHDLPPETLRNMTRIVCQALRLALGLPTSVSQEQVYSEAGILPLRHRLKRDACRYLFGSARVPNSTDAELTEGWVENQTTALIQGLPSSIKDICLAAGLRPDDRRLVSQHQFDPVPPWDLDPPDVTPGIPGLNRDDSPHLLLMRTRELLARKYAEDFLVYTDGSVREDGRTGAGVFLQPTNESFSVKLPPTTIQTAELVAIRESVVKVINLPQSPPRVTILSDSRISLTILQGAYYESRPELLDDILRLSTEATNLGVRLRFQWVPSHVGLHGNEMADSAAKRGALLPEENRVVFQLTACDAFRRIEQASWGIWESDYAASRGWPTTRSMTKASASCVTTSSHIFQDPGQPLVDQIPTTYLHLRHRTGVLPALPLLLPHADGPLPPSTRPSRRPFYSPGPPPGQHHHGFRPHPYRPGSPANVLLPSRSPPLKKRRIILNTPSHLHIDRSLWHMLLSGATPPPRTHNATAS
ncbi:uncharacterized protein LOC143020099 [Oratosquilla oratoria]|uniref:uncharacterized protein LOC143020099 n=1 Tax=Oratosquilla oratoria TaxID=337810 RepID=UPI003F76ADD0